MPTRPQATYEEFLRTLRELTKAYASIHRDVRQLDEANVRLEYIDQFFMSLGWDVGNQSKVALHAREVVVEPPSPSKNGRSRPDYIFRIGGIDKFVCEAKRPSENVERHYFQIQNYVYNLRLWVGILFNFEELVVFVVGGQPSKKRPFSPPSGWRLYFDQYDRNAQKIWDLLARDNVEAGSLEKFAQSLEKVGRKGKQGWLIKPDRTRTVDADFLNYLEIKRKELAKKLQASNARLRDGTMLWGDGQLNEAVQKIINRLLFQRICEDRGIDVGRSLQGAVTEWDVKGRISSQLWDLLMVNFRHLSRTFNGGLFGSSGDRHFVDELRVDDEWLESFIDDISADDSPYLFSIIPVDILGSVYERFLGSVALPNGKVEQKLEVRKAGGVYYTPRLIVGYIVESAVEQKFRGKSPREMARIKVLDPACGSGSFLLRAFERICELHIDWLIRHPAEQKKNLCYHSKAGDLHLTTGFKRSILLNNIVGVDIDPQAIEVTQMSLYLKVLEGETRETLALDHKLFPTQTYLPDLSENIKCGNSLIGSDVIELLDDEGGAIDAQVTHLRPFDWEREFPKILGGGKSGFDVVLGNPPYVNVDDVWGRSDVRLKYLKRQYNSVYNDKTDLLFYFLKKAIDLSKGDVAFIVSRAFMEAYKADKLRGWISENSAIKEIVDFRNRYVFAGVGITTAIVHVRKERFSGEAHVYQLLDTNADIQNLKTSLRDREIFREISVPQRQFGSAAWQFAKADTAKLIQKIDSAGVELGKILTLGQGMQTGRNNVFGGLAIEQIEAWGLLADHYYERARNSDIQRYHIRESSDWLLYLENVPSFHDLPDGVRRHLKHHEKALKERAAYIRGNCEWWRYTWPLHKDLYKHDKLYCPYLATTNRFALDEERRFLGLTDTTVIFDSGQPENLRYFLALLNSELLTWRFRYIGKLKGGGIYEYFWNSLSKIPIRRLDMKSKAEVEIHDRLINLVDKQIKLSAASFEASGSAKAELFKAVSAVDRNINDIVYDLFNITKEEKELIQAAVAEVS